MKIALIQCPAWGRQNPPLALSMLSAYLRSKGRRVYNFDLNNKLFHRVKVEDRLLWQLNKEEFWEDKHKVLKFTLNYKELINDCINEIFQTDANIIGFSIFNSSKEFSLLMAKEIKDKAKDKVIIFGGPHCFPHMQGSQIIQGEAVDIIVIGEGEVTLDELICQIELKGGVSFCEGTWFKKGDKIIDCGHRALINDLNKLPFADFEDFALDSYEQPNRLPIYLSRGCPNRCVYCNENIFWRGYRYRSGERVFEEIRNQSNRHKGVNHFDFVDQLVNGNPRELRKLADLIIKEGLKITWAGQAVIRPYMAPKLLKRLKKSGCVCLAYGLESGSQKVLDLMQKGFRVEEAERVIRDTYAEGIDVVTNFMFGFPGETDEDFKVTLDFVSRNKEYISTVNPSPAFTAIGAGSYLYEHADELSIDLSAGHLFWNTKSKDNTYEVRRKRYEEFCNLAASLGIKFSFPVNINQED